ncbi:MAG: hypothetical protein H0V66_10935 [Bdellovibrionales bacterium]|nr:hypothetical protein [Bdellovibrionales bacterium]
MTADNFWKDKLIPLVERDQFIRDALDRRGVLEDAYHPEMEKVHLENARKLKELIKKNGFPVLSNAGEEGVQLSWLIIQHAISSPDFMRECLTEIRMAVAQDDYPKDLLAYIDDRIRYFEGLPQLYGTNFDWEDGELRPTPIEDPKFLDLRRKSLGLPPIAETLFKIAHSAPPKDPLKKASEFQKWLLSVGWRV